MHSMRFRAGHEQITYEIAIKTKATVVPCVQNEIKIMIFPHIKIVLNTRNDDKIQGRLLDLYNCESCQ